MSEKEPENQEWTDPNDFGLPHVELNPLSPVQIPKKEENPFIPDSIDISLNKQSSKEPEVAVEEVQIREENFKKNLEQKKKNKKSTKLWVWPVVILTLGALGVIVWQNMDLLKLESKLKVESVPQPVEKKPEPAAEIITSDKNQPADNQDTSAISKNSTSISSIPEETGTTIVTGNQERKLIRIDSRAEKVRYFVVAASLPNERLALEVIDKFSGKSPEFYLIYPFESNRNYRVAVSKFNTWKEASDEAAKIRSQFSEDMWILTY